MTVYNNSNADENIYRLRTKKLTFNENKTKVLSWVEKIYFIQPYNLTIKSLEIPRARKTN